MTDEQARRKATDLLDVLPKDQFHVGSAYVYPSMVQQVAAALLSAYQAGRSAGAERVAELLPKEGCCGVCGLPMLPGETMFKYHGHSESCEQAKARLEVARRLHERMTGA